MLSDDIKERLKTLKEDDLTDRYNELNILLPEIKKLEKENAELRSILKIDIKAQIYKWDDLTDEAKKTLEDIEKSLRRE